MLKIGRKREGGGVDWVEFPTVNTSYDVFEYTATIETNETTSGTTLEGRNIRDIAGTRLSVVIPLDITKCTEEEKWRLIRELTRPVDNLVLKLPTKEERGLSEFVYSVEEVQWKQVQSNDNERVYLTDTVSITATTQGMWRK